jgi:hypothetical protein
MSTMSEFLDGNSYGHQVIYRPQRVNGTGKNIEG